MIKCEPFEISKDVYDRAMKNGGYITRMDETELFSISQLCGTGVYSDKAFEKDGKYYCSYCIGDSCD